MSLFTPAINKKNKVDVFVNDQTNPLFQYFFIRELKTDITLMAPVAVDATTINVSTGHGFTAAAGEVITIFEGNRYIQQTVKSVLADAVTISHPVPNTFTVAGAVVIRGNRLLNIDGSVTPATFTAALRSFTLPVDIGMIKICAVHAAEADDSKFAGITALTNGLFLRKTDGFVFNLGNYINNNDFRQFGASVEYANKAGGGAYSTVATFDILHTFGQVVRLDARAGDELLAVVRDDLSGLTSLTISAIGSYTDEI